MEVGTYVDLPVSHLPAVSDVLVSSANKFGCNIVYWRSSTHCIYVTLGKIDLLCEFGTKQLLKST